MEGPGARPADAAARSEAGLCSEAEASSPGPAEEQRPAAAGAPEVALAPSSYSNAAGSLVVSLGGVSPAGDSLTIVSASGLRAANSALLGGKSDPWCRCLLGGAEVARTHKISSTLNPRWDASSALPGDALGGLLEFEVRDWDQFGKGDQLGTASLRLACERGRSGVACDRELPLVGRQAKGSLRVRLVGARPADARAHEEALPSVTIVRAAGLRRADGPLPRSVGGGLSDPFCKCRVTRGRGDSQEVGKTGKLDRAQAAEAEKLGKTKVIKRTLDPVWGQALSLPVDARGCELEFGLWDHDRMSAADFLGEARLPLGSLAGPIGAVEEVELKLDGDKARGTLTVRLEGAVTVERERRILGSVETIARWARGLKARRAAATLRSWWAKCVRHQVVDARPRVIFLQAPSARAWRCRASKRGARPGSSSRGCSPAPTLAGPRTGRPARPS
ncbi:unnamed protein product [Prorocentrum cordatum]|uniref:C2 domain-containing protein n=1 Tax=Prorocentrum cordatum TaxID=2364126 RepID=A0ABN9UWU3_9DINO|nr:unnamed protein product [Polarella glacialis]